MNRPIGRVATWTEIIVMISGSVRYMKKVLRKDSKTQEIMPRNHIRKVHTGNDGSSRVETVNLTCSTGDSSESSSISGGFWGSGSIPRGSIVARERVVEWRFRRDTLNLYRMEECKYTRTRNLIMIFFFYL